MAPKGLIGDSGSLTAILEDDSGDVLDETFGGARAAQNNPVWRGRDVALSLPCLASLATEPDRFAAPLNNLPAPTVPM
jgi:hypothetical protein